MKKIGKILSGVFLLTLMILLFPVPASAGPSNVISRVNVNAIVPEADDVVPDIANEPWPDQGNAAFNIVRDEYLPVSQEYYRFRRDTVYTYRVSIVPKEEGAVFDRNGTYTINGNPAVVTEFSEREVTLEYAFPRTSAAGKYTLLDWIELYIEAPAIGEEAKTLKILFPEGALYTSETAPDVNFWYKYDEEQGKYIESSEFGNMIIQPNSKYHCEIIIDPLPGYIMDDNTRVLINGQETTKYLPPHSNPDGYSARFFFETESAEDLKGANIGIDPPFAGDRIIDHQAFTTETGYVILDTKWNPHTSEEFQMFTEYTVQVVLEARNYTGMFIRDGGVFTINGHPAEVREHYGEVVVLEYTFPIEDGGFVTLENGKLAYIKSDRSYAKSEFITANGFTYYFDENGYMVQNGFRAVGKDWYYFERGGEMTVGFRAVGKTWYYFEPNGRMAKGWKQIDGFYYYFNGSGAMVKGWLKEGNNWFYLNGSGHMVTGWQAIGGKWYYFYGSGRMLTGWQVIDGHWYYLKPSGEMTKGWLKEGRNWFYFNGSGHMVTGWQVVGGKWYYFYGSGRMVTGWQVIDGYWYYLKPSGEMTKGWLKEGRNWFYFDGSGHMVTGRRLIDGKWYTFKSNGAMQ